MERATNHLETMTASQQSTLANPSRGWRAHTWVLTDPWWFYAQPAPPVQRLIWVKATDWMPVKWARP